MTRRANRRRHNRNLTRARAVGGALLMLVLAAAIYVSYNAIHGLPFQSVYHVTVYVPNGDRLVSTDDVRIHGLLSGSVADVEAVKGKIPYARVSLNLDPSVAPLPTDTTVKVGLSSALGATYVDLIPGHSAHTVPNDGSLSLSHARPTVDLVDLLDIFNQHARPSIQATFDQLGDGVAGRGPALNQALDAAAGLLAPLTRVNATLAARPTRLGPFMHAYESFAGALAPVASRLGDLMRAGGQTFGAFQRAHVALGKAIDEFPSTERAATDAFTRLQPALAGVARIVVDLRPAGALLPGSLAQIDRSLAAGVQPLRQAPPFAVDLRGTLRSLRVVASKPTTRQAITRIGTLLTAAAPLVRQLDVAQVKCNVGGAFASVFPKDFATGGGGYQALGGLGFTSSGAQNSVFQHAAPSPNLGVNYLPHEDASECEAGNEPAPPSNGPPVLKNPSGNQPTAMPPSSPPPGVTALARKAGLLNAPPGTPR